MSELKFRCVAFLGSAEVKVEESSRCKVGACKEVTELNLSVVEMGVEEGGSGGATLETAKKEIGRAHV